MSKLHPWDLACFDSVAAVIGQANAMEALQDAIDNDAIMDAGESDVAVAINWARTHGGIEYWAKIDLKIKENKWMDGEQRMNNIAQNSNEGEHYDDVACTIESTLNNREENYGSFSDVANTTQTLKSIVRSGVSYEKLSCTQLESLDMICSKIARIVNGDPTYIDSWHDISGYATLEEKELQK